MKVFLITLFAAATVFTQGFALECFICNDCASLEGVQAQQCTDDNIFPPTEGTTTTTTLKPTDTTDTTTTPIPDTTTTLAPDTTTTLAPDTTTTTTTLDPETTTPTTTESTTASMPTGSPPTTTSGPPVTQSGLNRFKRQAENGPEFRCFTAEVENTTRRGCTRWLANEEQTCSVITTADVCNVCNENQCNSAAGLMTSMLTIFAAALVAMKIL